MHFIVKREEFYTDISDVLCKFFLLNSWMGKTSRGGMRIIFDNKVTRIFQFYYYNISQWFDKRKMDRYNIYEIKTMKAESP